MDYRKILEQVLRDIDSEMLSEGDRAWAEVKFHARRAWWTRLLWTAAIAGGTAGLSFKFGVTFLLVAASVGLIIYSCPLWRACDYDSVRY